MKHALAYFTLSLCAGIIFANVIRLTFGLIFLFACLVLVCCLLSLKKSFRSDIFLLLLVFLSGSLLLINSKKLPKCHISNFIHYKRASPYIIKGIIVSEPSFRKGKTSFILESEELLLNDLKLRSCGRILVNIKNKQDLEYAEELLLRGPISLPPWFIRERPYGIMNVNIRSDVVSLGKHNVFLLKRLSFRLKKKIKHIISRNLPELPAGMLNAMILGERRVIPKPIRDSMIKSGTVHILVVSGFHTGVVAFILTVFLKSIRLPKSLRPYIVICLVILYCFLSGASTPVVRATIMAIFFILGFSLNREPDIYNSCALAAAGILIYKPRQLFDAGFQLSFASVLSIVYFYPKIKLLLKFKRLQPKAIGLLLHAAAVSFSAWLGTMGFIAYYFKVFSPVTILANILILPLAVLIILSGFCLVCLGFIVPPLAYFCGLTVELAVALLIITNAFLIKLPGAYFYF